MSPRAEKMAKVMAEARALQRDIRADKLRLAGVPRPFGRPVRWLLNTISRVAAWIERKAREELS